jgi:putative phage-type endonuclease
MRLFGKKLSIQAHQNKRPAPATAYPYYEIASMVQGSDEWKNWRRRVVGASDAPIIMFENRWTRPESLIEEKLGTAKEFAGNAATREGQQLEGTVRNLLQDKYGTRLKASVVQDGQVPYFAASLDAIDDKHSSVYEIKCGAKAYSIVATTKSIPEYYRAQLQHILMVTQLDKLIYAAYRPNSRLITVEVGRNESYIKRMREAEELFAERLRRSGLVLQESFLGNRIERFSPQD